MREAAVDPNLNSPFQEWHQSFSHGIGVRAVCGCIHGPRHEGCDAGLNQNHSKIRQRDSDNPEIAQIF